MKPAFILTRTNCETLILAGSQRAAVPGSSVNTAELPLAWKSVFSDTGLGMREEPSSLSLSSPLAPLKSVPPLQDQAFGPGRRSLENSGPGLINQVFVSQFTPNGSIGGCSPGSPSPRFVGRLQMYNHLQSGHPAVSITIW